MKRSLLQQPLCALLRLFFRRLQVTGREQVPEGPVIFVLNHPNALIDPLILLCQAGRPVSFLAKEPLFRIPLIGAIVRAMDSIPVYRRMDQADTARNVATFAAARALLSRGGSLALFPEGTSHSDPRLKPFRTGAARIALGAQVPGLRIVPAGLFYTAKSRFRSQALLCFGPPVAVPDSSLGPESEPAPDQVRDLTARLEQALGALTIQADEHQAVALAEAAERIFHSASVGDRQLLNRLQLRQRLLWGYTQLRTADPDRLNQLIHRINTHQTRLRATGLSPELLPTEGYHVRAVVRVTTRSLLGLLLLLPLAMLGMMTHLLPWLLIDLVGRRVKRTSMDVVSTAKLIAGVVLYPLTWLAGAWLATRQWGLRTGLLMLVMLPLSGLIAVLFSEDLRRLVAQGRGLRLALTGRRRFLRLVAERQAIRQELVALAEKLEQAPDVRQRPEPGLRTEVSTEG